VGLLVVSALTLLLPAIHLGLAAAIGYGVYCHATEHAVILRGGGKLWRAVAYLALIAEHVERTCGLPPPAAPPDDEDELWWGVTGSARRPGRRRRSRRCRCG